MKTYIVLYRIEDAMAAGDAPFAFHCQADDHVHAEEQCANAYPTAEIMWVYKGASTRDAYSEYWNI